MKAAIIGLSLWGLTSCTPQQDDATEARALLLNPDHSAWSETAPARYRARFETNEGTFVIAVDRSWAPLGADRFYNLVRHGFYDGVRFSRTVEGFIAQWGLSGDPAVTRVWKDRAILDDPVRQSNLRGYVAFAMTGPDTRTTQVFIPYVDLSRLDEQGFAPFGRVVEGMEVVDSLYSGYGEDSGGGVRRGMQGPIEEGGTTYLLETYPELDYIVRAVIEEEKR